MLELLLFIIVFACIMSVRVRVIVTHPFSTVWYGVIDLYKYFRYHRWNECVTGTISAFVGLFGKGKTLSAVHWVVTLYKRYNDKKIYDFNRKKFVTQKIHIISNVSLAIPYEDFVSLSQIVAVADRMRSLDEQNDTRTCTIVLGDEFSVQLNSRSFKSNIDPLFLNTLLTCRHHHISLIYTSQRFNHVDALLRQVTSYVYTCNKIWRIMVHEQYDAFDLENASDPTLIKPKRRFGWFIKDAHFNAYDTLACVGNLTKSCKEGDMLTEEQILDLQRNNPVNIDGIVNPSRKLKRASKKLRK